MRPVFTIVAGSNGSGKTTLTKAAREEFQFGALLDPDAVVKSEGTGSQIQAAKQVLQQADALIEKRQSFTVETTLSGNTYLRLAARAKEDGFVIAIIFVGTNSVDINIERIRGRVAKGGHDIPEAVQRRRWPRTLTNIIRIFPLASFVLMLDNSSESGYSLVATSQNQAISWSEPIPEWASHIREAIGRGL